MEMKKTMKLKVLRNKVLVRPCDPAGETVGGIVIPSVMQQRQDRGEVLVIGTGWKAKDGRQIYSSAKVGEIVLYLREAGTPIIIDGEELLVLTEDDLLGVEKFDAAVKF